MKNWLFIFLLAMSCGNNTEPQKPADATPDTTVVRLSKDSLASLNTALPGEPGIKIYKGAWFAISYPEAFTVQPSLPSATSSEGNESAFFTSPGGEVSFYVFSPQWSGTPTDIALQPNEKIISRDSSYSQERRSMAINWTIEANDKTYRRSYQEIKMDENINWIFGIKYKDEAAYNKYKQDYINFKNSIIQYAD